MISQDNGSITVISFATSKIVTTWRIPGGGSPDMGNLSPDGTVFWVSGRYNNVVYAIATATGRLLAKVPVGPQPHGLCVWPQPAATPWATPGSPGEHQPATALQRIAAGA